MKVGFIGTGNMGGSMIRGMVTSGAVSGGNINVFDLDRMKAEELAKEYEVTLLSSEAEVAKKSDIVILAVKPNIYRAVLEKIKDIINRDKVILTIGAGISNRFVEDMIGEDKKVVRTMPNTPAQVLEGMTAVTFNSNISE